MLLLKQKLIGKKLKALGLGTENHIQTAEQTCPIAFCEVWFSTLVSRSRDTIGICCGFLPSYAGFLSMEAGEVTVRPVAVILLCGHSHYEIIPEQNCSQSHKLGLLEMNCH